MIQFKQFIRLKAIAACLALCASLHPASAQDIDKELARVATLVSDAVDAAGVKTVVTADFVDLHGEVSELGRFIAEELSTNLVQAKKNFSVVDRANMKRIMDEHKLTMSGLVDPENAKKLGQFAGVDAIIIGTITPLGEKVRISIKIITTDTSKIVGAARGDILKTKAIQDLLGQGATAPTSPATSASIPPAEGNQKPAIKARTAELIRSVNFALELVRYTSDRTLSASGEITNKSAKEITVYTGVFVDDWASAQAYAANGGQFLKASAVDESGNKFLYKSAEGFITATSPTYQYPKKRPYIYAGLNQFAVILPGESAPVTLFLASKEGVDRAPKSVDLLIEFQIFSDPQSVQSLTKTVRFRSCGLQQ